MDSTAAFEAVDPGSTPGEGTNIQTLFCRRVFMLTKDFFFSKLSSPKEEIMNKVLPSRLKNFSSYVPPELQEELKKGQVPLAEQIIPKKKSTPLKQATVPAGAPLPPEVTEQAPLPSDPMDHTDQNVLTSQRSRWRPSLVTLG